ncbi:hypothetical protein GLYMA_19G242500v4 [Glycine max]|uniref:Uncharacterized protein n=1 Tax=Glycine max TaxID=3847 RepID=A0A0R0ESC6_SOYBN|nr:hypothetical protein GYH30_054089 [Glycine max]KRG96939.1 hypothetical protein GLYMA_19G242500v4 [Glycine max]
MILCIKGNKINKIYRVDYFLSRMSCFTYVLLVSFSCTFLFSWNLALLLKTIELSLNSVIISKVVASRNF